MSIDRRAGLAIAFAMLTASGCGEAEEARPFARRTVALKDLPPTVLDAATKELPGTKFEDAWQEVDKDGKVQFYEVRGRNQNGKVLEVEVSESGRVLKKE